MLFGWKSLYRDYAVFILQIVWVHCQFLRIKMNELLRSCGSAILAAPSQWAFSSWTGNTLGKMSWLVWVVWWTWSSLLVIKISSLTHSRNLFADCFIQFFSLCCVSKLLAHPGNFSQTNFVNLKNIFAMRINFLYQGQCQFICCLPEMLILDANNM